MYEDRTNRRETVKPLVGLKVTQCMVHTPSAELKAPSAQLCCRPAYSDYCVSACTPPSTCFMSSDRRSNCLRLSLSFPPMSAWRRTR
jgi:hypothetical protein